MHCQRLLLMILEALMVIREALSVVTMVIIREALSVVTMVIIREDLSVVMMVIIREALSVVTMVVIAAKVVEPTIAMEEAAGEEMVEVEADGAAVLAVVPALAVVPVLAVVAVLAVVPEEEEEDELPC